MARTFIDKHIEIRRRRARELGRMDAANRCTFCRRALAKFGVLLLLTPAGEQLRYCDDNCRQDHVDALQTMEARRA